MDFTITGRTAIYTISHSVGIARTTSTMDNQFYVHLFSNGNEKYFPENTSSHFTSLLPEILHLTGRWYVGLAEIEYKHQLKGKERPLHLCVSTDICLDSITGNTKAGVLKYMLVMGQKGKRMLERFAPVHYILVNKQEIDRIDINIINTTFTNDELFGAEPVRCTLHFTKAPPFVL